jgi:hypothetical protein
VCCDQSIPNLSSVRQWHSPNCAELSHRPTVPALGGTTPVAIPLNVLLPGEDSFHAEMAVQRPFVWGRVTKPDVFKRTVHCRNVVGFVLDRILARSLALLGRRSGK